MAAVLELEQIVRQELQAQQDAVAALVDELLRDMVRQQLAQRLNGHGPGGAAEMPPGPDLVAPDAPEAEDAPVDPPRASTASETKQCGICHQVKNAAEFDTGRKQCRSCRSERYGHRRQPDTTA